MKIFRFQPLAWALVLVWFGVVRSVSGGQSDPVNCNGFDDFATATNIVSGIDEYGGSPYGGVTYFFCDVFGSGVNGSTIEEYSHDDPAPTALPGGRPDRFEGTKNAKYLRLWTAADVPLYRTFNPVHYDTERYRLDDTEKHPIGANGTYIDALVQFTPSDSAPSQVDGEEKLAMWMNNTSNLCARAMRFEFEATDDNDYDMSPPSECEFVFKGEFEPDRWYRLTVKAVNSLLLDDCGEYMPAFQVYVDGVALETTEAALNDAALKFYRGVRPDGTGTTEYGRMISEENAELVASCKVLISSKYIDVVEEGDADLQAVGFRGEGRLDDLVLTDYAPGFLVPTTAIDFTLAWDETVSAVAFTIVSNDIAISSGAAEVSPGVAGSTNLVGLLVDWRVEVAASYVDGVMPGPWRVNDEARAYVDGATNFVVKLAGGVGTVAGALKVVRIGEVYYSSLFDALASIERGDAETRIDFVADVDLASGGGAGSATIADGTSVVLDLNGRTLRGDAALAGRATLVNEGTLTILDSSLEGTGTVEPTCAGSLESVHELEVRGGNYPGLVTVRQYQTGESRAVLAGGVYGTNVLAVQEFGDGWPLTAATLLVSNGCYAGEVKSGPSTLPGTGASPVAPSIALCGGWYVDKPAKEYVAADHGIGHLEDECAPYKWKVELGITAVEFTLSWSAHVSAVWYTVNGGENRSISVTEGEMDHTTIGELSPGDVVAFGATPSVGYDVTCPEAFEVYGDEEKGITTQKKVITFTLTKSGVESVTYTLNGASKGVVPAEGFACQIDDVIVFTPTVWEDWYVGGEQVPTLDVTYDAGRFTVQGENPQAALVAGKAAVGPEATAADVEAQFKALGVVNASLTNAMTAASFNDFVDWAIDRDVGVDEANDGEHVVASYLVDADDLLGAAPVLKICTFAADGADGWRLVVECGTAVDADAYSLDAAKLRGALVIESAAELGGEWTELGYGLKDLGVVESTKRAFTVSAEAGPFLRARLKVK